jgi:hypothetical protein
MKTETLKECWGWYKEYSSSLQGRQNLTIYRDSIRNEMKMGNHIVSILGQSEIAKKTFGEVFTPPELVDDMLDHLPKEEWTKLDNKWIDNSCGTGVFLWHGVVPRLMKSLEKDIPDLSERKKHIAGMVYGVDIQPSNIGIARQYMIDLLGEENKETICKNFVRADSLTFDYWGMKFDVVVGNPPYQDNAKGGGKLGSFPLWIRFVNKSTDILKKGGLLVYVHPALWRQPLTEKSKCPVLREKQLLYLEIHSLKDGSKMFGANTRYDFYVLQNDPIYKKTVIVDEDGNLLKIDLKKWIFIPNKMFDDIEKLITKEDEDKVELLYSRSMYGTDKKNMKVEEDEEFKYPCVYSINRENKEKLFYSNSKKDFFVPKVIFASGATGFISDKKGKYGLTQFACGIVDNVANLDSIKWVLDCDRFKDIIKAVSVSKEEINKNILSLFRKDFWKEFIDE